MTHYTAELNATQQFETYNIGCKHFVGIEHDVARARETIFWMVRKLFKNSLNI